MLARHDLLWLSEQGWREAVWTVPEEAAPALLRWRACGWPAVMRRADADLAPGQVSVGIPLPPRAEDGRKLRVAGRVALDAIVRQAPPLPLAQLSGMPAHWHAPLAALAQQAQTHGLAIGVFGSAALQAITGQAYLRAGSDIDLLLQPRSVTELDTALALLRTHARGLPLDGEIVFPGGRAVAWKELSAAREGSLASRVLVKELRRVALVRIDELLASLEEQACLN
ncbi:malonate decarboxylase holo-[acyl-carrier-protein] synthase [Massilia sp. Mn16-1_5]|uniref:malonate decarboxylase holo-[acyl-carrier-protein] synthase n=1 Tax=Massilia sp. Mn16-1_5 TaxID=2079199 RepID=UPI00109E41EE|nr:malonate decarboxylase holo-[acyl-carrier-protein] synthase [Massilia sp. Mn16-1_5]THC40826.1 malonate decarboxylase holo-[acyl-carrier-protein] synthase [Massilia sp. Mn16-1_5]